MHKLDKTEAVAQLHGLAHWVMNAQCSAIRRDYVLVDFIQAFAFMAQIAMSAERRNHHPEWSNVYNRVSITWTTHDVNGLSSEDIAMAHLCDQAFASYASVSIST